MSESERTICAYFFAEQTTWNYTLLEGDGNFSHVKILPNKKLFIVRWQNICEIRKMNESFTVEKQFKNIGEEVIATDVFFPEKSKNIESENKNDQKDEFSKKNEKELEKIIVKDDDNMIITLLDVEGNINSWESGSSIKTVVNLFDMKDISTEYKNKQFFSMGYPYFIKSNKDFYAFSSDHGVFLLKK